MTPMNEYAFVDCGPYMACGLGVDGHHHGRFGIGEVVSVRMNKAFQLFRILRKEVVVE